MSDRVQAVGAGTVAACHSACPGRSILLAAITLLALLPVTALAEAPWGGNWQTYWRDGAAILTLDQEGTRVTGTYEPGGGRVLATTDGVRLVGTWQQRGASGNFVFALDAERDTFTGRYESGEYWNGERMAADAAITGPFTRTDTPREAMRTLLAAGNRVAYGGEPGAMRVVEQLISFEGEATDSRDERLRRRMLWQLVDLSTFRIRDMPGNLSDDETAFRIGPAGTNETFELRFARQAGNWHLLVPKLDQVEADTDRILEALGHPSVEAALAERADSPRGALRRFLLGTQDWNGPGRSGRSRRSTCPTCPHSFTKSRHPCLLTISSACSTGRDTRSGRRSPTTPRGPHPMSIIGIRQARS